MKDRIIYWFEKLSLPEEWRAEVLNAVESFDADAISANEDPYAWLAAQDNKMLCLLYALSQCDNTAEFYRKKGIPDDILYATLAELKRYSVEYHKITGGEKIGILQIAWCGKVLKCLIYRLGRLQFEFREAMADWSKFNVKIGDKVLNVHIPNNGPFDPDSCAKSYAMSEVFFAKYFPEYEYKCYACNSWLLDETLKSMLKPTSNILLWAKEFEVVKSKEKYDSLIYLFVRGTTLEDVPNLKPVTSLQKNVVEHIKKGGKMYVSYGFRPR